MSAAGHQQGDQLAIDIPRVDRSSDDRRGYARGVHDWELWADHWTSLALVSQAAASVLTVIAAIAAAFYAAAQVRQARALREEQARPFVTVSFRPSHGIVCNIVIKNEGATLARNVRFRFSPEWESSSTERNKIKESKIWREGIPTLVPGQEIAILADMFPDRYKREDLPRTYAVEVQYEGAALRSERKPTASAPTFVLSYTLDFDIFFGYNHAQLYGLHEIADAARKIRSRLDSWSEYSGGPLSVMIRNGDMADDKEAREFDALRHSRSSPEVPPRRARGTQPAMESQNEPIDDSTAAT